MVRRKIILITLSMAMAACAATDPAEESRTNTAMPDFIEVNELEPVGSMRVSDRLSFDEIDDKHVVVRVRNLSYLVEYASRCMQHPDGRVNADVRRDPRRIYAGADTFRGCRIKTIYVLEPGQADELIEIGESVGGER